jgi:hypothetical protein
MRSEVSRLQREVRAKQPTQLPRPATQWMQLYFREPFTVEEGLDLLGECVEEAIKQKCLKEDATCSVEHVADFADEPKRGWQALRLTCQGATSVLFRKCVKNIFVHKSLDEGVVSSKKPSQKSELYRQSAIQPPIFEGQEAQCLKQLILERV